VKLQIELEKNLTLHANKTKELLDRLKAQNWAESTSARASPSTATVVSGMVGPVSPTPNASELLFASGNLSANATDLDNNITMLANGTLVNGSGALFRNWSSGNWSYGNWSSGNFTNASMIDLPTALLAPDVKSLVLSGLNITVPPDGDTSSIDSVIAATVSLACEGLHALRVDTLGLAALAVFETESHAFNCLLQETVEVDGVDAAVAPVNYCGGEEFAGLFPLHLSTAHREDDKEVVAYAAPSELLVMASGVPANLPDTALIRMAEAYGNVTLVQRSRPDGVVVFEFHHRAPVIAMLEAGSVTVHRLHDTYGKWVFGDEDPAEANESSVTNVNAETKDDFYDAFPNDWPNYGYTDDFVSPYGAQRFEDDVFPPPHDEGDGKNGGQRRHLLASIGRHVLSSKPTRTEPETRSPRRSHDHTTHKAKYPTHSTVTAATPVVPGGKRHRRHASKGMHHRAATAHHTTEGSTRSAVTAATPTVHGKHARAHATVTSDRRHGHGTAKHRHMGHHVRHKNRHRNASKATAHGRQSRVNLTLAPELANLTGFGDDEVMDLVNGSLLNETTPHLKPRTNWTIAFWPVSRVGEARNLTVFDLPNVTDEVDGEGDRTEQVEEEDEKISSSRFQDNSELQYSLRSIEKNAPWVRNIYIVTNGQIPSWLNLDHPRIQVVPHDDIFRNKSHLPVFSSPAIESHLHQIPGLSKKFIYLNDDVLFGTEVWPDDFYSPGTGQKVFEAWPVPNCKEGCPSNWLKDGYCDAACNNADCDWDAGDCKKDEKKTDSGKDAWTKAGHSGTGMCASGCTDAWLSDKFCDKACKTPECGMDVGDCGIDAVVAEVQGYLLPENDTEILHCDYDTELKTVHALYVNLTDVLTPFDTVKDGSHDSPESITTAILNDPDRILMIVLRPKLNETVINVTISGTRQYPRLWPAGPTFPSPNISVGNQTNDTAMLNETLPRNTTAPTPKPTHRYQLKRHRNTTVTSTTVTSTSTSSTVTTTVVPLKEDFEISFRLIVCTNLFVTTTPSPFASLNMSNATNATLSNGTLTSIRIENGTDIINYWEIVNGTNVTLSNGTIGNSTADNSTLVNELAQYELPDINRTLLPNETQYALQELQDEFDNGWLTRKGLARYTYDVLLPFASNATDGDSTTGGLNDVTSMMTTIASLTSTRHYNQHMGKAHEKAKAKGRRHLMSLQGRDATLDFGGYDGDLHSPFIERNGYLITRDEAYRADYIADQKRKFFSFEEDMQKSIKAWERQTGRKWVNGTLIRRKERSFLPWERLGTFDDLVGDEGYGGSEVSYLEDEDGRRPWRSRQTLDTFGDSLKKVNRMYNQHFGYHNRRVIAHMPHFIDRDIMRDLVREFPEEWEATSSHRLRSGDDMQYAFAYYHFLAETSSPFNASATFDDFDMDSNGLLSVHELRTIVVRLYNLPTKADDWHDFEHILLNCTADQDELDAQGVGIGPDGKVVWITRDIFVNCTQLVDKLNATMGAKKSYKTDFISEQEGLKYVAFEMIRNNLSVVDGQLNAIRKDPKRFTCLNDNIDHRLQQSKDIVSALHDFYEAFYPVRSQFELPIGMRNRFLHMKDLREWQRRQKRVMNWSRISLIFAVVAIAAILTVRRLRRRGRLGRRLRD